MANISDYIKWRGDVSFKYSVFNEVDALIFSQLSYLDFEDIVSENFNETISFSDAAELINRKLNYNPGFLVNREIFELLKTAGKSVRFGTVQLCGYIATFDVKKEKQFAALTFIPENKKEVYVVFRGTDDTLIGWKEDLNMAFMAPVPAQKESIKYLEKAAEAFKKKIITAGHSKGGNLAIYSSAFCSEKIRRRITKIYNNDGPGFDLSVLKDGHFDIISDRIQNYIPQNSIVGMILDHVGNTTVVESSESGFMQHDPFSWHVYGKNFTTLDSTTAGSQFLDSTLKNWLQETPRDKREDFVDALYEILSDTGATTITELADNIKQRPAHFIKCLTKLESKTKKAVLQALKILFKAAKKSLPSSLF